MIYHSLTLDPATGKPAKSWWAVHAETLTPVLIDGTRFPSFSLEIIGPPEGQVIDFASHPDIPVDPVTIGKEVMRSIRHHFHPKASLKSRRLISRKDSKVPEYLLVSDGAGEHPAIYRSGDPMLIIPATPEDETILGQPLYWSSIADLSAEGWAYWWEDCQRALDQLAPAFIAAAGA